MYFKTFKYQHLLNIPEQYHVAQKRPPTVRRSHRSGHRLLEGQGRARIGWDLKGNCSYSENARYRRFLVGTLPMYGQVAIIVQGERYT